MLFRSVSQSRYRAQVPPLAGKLVTGVTVKAAFLTQHLDELDSTWRVLEAVEKVAQHIELSDGKSLSASQLCERLGFSKDAQWTPVRDLSGGEKRRLQLTRLLMGSPNVLLLDEPTNDFDIETLTELEDLLDSFGGVLLVISHDRYFLERVCDRFVGLLGDSLLQDLPRGVDQYLELHKRKPQQVKKTPEKESSSSADNRQAKKDLARIEKQIEKLKIRIDQLLQSQEAAAFEPDSLHQITTELNEVRNELSLREEEWLEISLLL